MAFRNWATKKLSKTVEAVVEPVKQNIAEEIQKTKDNAGNSAGLLSNVLKAGICVLIGVILMRDDKEERQNARITGALSSGESLPGKIIINNYIQESSYRRPYNSYRNNYPKDNYKRQGGQRQK